LFALTAPNPIVFMLIKFVEIRNFRKLKSCRIDFSDEKTVFVGANNCGKTSAMDALFTFLKNSKRLHTRDFTLSNWEQLNKIGDSWLVEESPPDLSIALWEEFIPQLDVWLNVPADEIHHVHKLLPTLEWKDGLLGVRLRFQPKNIEKLYADYLKAFKAAKGVTAQSETHGEINLKLWPKNLLSFLERKLHTYFEVYRYVLDAERIVPPNINGVANPQKLMADASSLDHDPFKGLIKIDVISAQRGFSDSNADPEDKLPIEGSLTAQFKTYYAKHLDPTEAPEVKDLTALQAIEEAQALFDEKLTNSFGPSLRELEKLNYPGFGGNPRIKLSSRLKAIDGLNHGSSIQFSLLTHKDTVDATPTLPEKYNGLGYQNLISMAFKLIGFRDEWMRVGKKLNSLDGNDSDTETEFEPLHIILIEEPEAFLHAQVQQVFIRKAYEILRSHDLLKGESVFRTQLIVSTHSSHIAHEIDFTSLRYFKRLPLEEGSVATSVVVNLSKTFGKEDETIRFAKRYLKTTHCDLFFADAVIIVEGAVERMLIPSFIENNYQQLSSCYIALLEIGGRHSYTLAPLLKDLGIITLIITDLDSIDPKDNLKSVLPQKGKGYLSGNTTLKRWLPGVGSIDDLMDISIKKELEGYPIRVAYQNSTQVKLEGTAEEVEIIPYTFEIALAFENLKLFQNLDGIGLIKKFKEASLKETVVEINSEFYNALKTGKKAEFALELLFLQDPNELAPPRYIHEGLSWLQNLLTPVVPGS
jgi:predicted ATP-dependent endonuclease of OLD family